MEYTDVAPTMIFNEKIESSHHYIR